MLFNSIDFAIFLPLVFIVYWLLQNHGLKWQNALLLVSSYIFYGWWDWRFLSLIIFSSFIDYFLGLSIAKSDVKRKRKLFLILSLVVNLGFLGFFKYYNFFAQNFADAFTFFGQSIEPSRLNIILPVGISFYTFQTLSYTIDVYRKKLEPTKDIIAFFTFVSFFPQLVAGPIERASNLLPQFFSKRTFIYKNAIDGCRQILWGLFKKVVIADNAAKYADMIFDNHNYYSGSTLVLGALFFAFQIYGDFSGYSDIAIGTSRLFGFNLKQNFAFPYFSRDMAEFWRRWHISLSTWFRDYLYIPLGGSRGSTLQKIRNIFIIFIISGFWHGANWTFIVWGLLNALYFLPLLLLNRNRKNIDFISSKNLIPSLKDVINMTLTFCLTLFAWIFFRAESLQHAAEYIRNVFTDSLFTIPNFIDQKITILILSLTLLFVGVEWIGKEQKYALEIMKNIKRTPIRWLLYICIAFLIFLFAGRAQDFIYFQF